MRWLLHTSRPLHALPLPSLSPTRTWGEFRAQSGEQVLESEGPGWNLSTITTTCVILSRLLKHSKVQLPHWKMGLNEIIAKCLTLFLQTCWGIKLIHRRCSPQHMAPIKFSPEHTNSSALLPTPWAAQHVLSHLRTHYAGLWESDGPGYLTSEAEGLAPRLSYPRYQVRRSLIDNRWHLSPHIQSPRPMRAPLNSYQISLLSTSLMPPQSRQQPAYEPLLLQMFSYPLHCLARVIFSKHQSNHVTFLPKILQWFLLSG